MAEHRWLIIHLEAPLMAFGGVTIDAIGVIRDFPATSMLTGLFANALGWRRTEWEKHQCLQDRLVFAARRDRENPAGVLTDVQNAQLKNDDKGWTTWGQPEGRAGGLNTFSAPHRRRRDYHMDAAVTIALRLEPEHESPNIEALAEALDRPARPLFIGRKPCLPSCRLNGGFVTAPTAYAALKSIPCKGAARALWPLGEGPQEGAEVHRIIDLPDIRNWRTGLHGGVRKVVEGTVTAERPGP